MALVKCPECGKEVSDTAVYCSGCGYAVKDQFAKNEVVKKEDEPVKLSAKLVECKKCGAKLNQGTEMCFKCGTYQENKAEEKSSEDSDSPYVRCPNCDSKVWAVSKFCIKCGASLPQADSSDNKIQEERKPEPKNQVSIGLGLVAVAFLSLFLPFIQLGKLALSLAQIKLVLPILGVSLGLTAIFIISKKKSGVIAMNVFSILFTAFVYYGEFADNSDLSRYVSPGVGAFLLPIALIAIWVYYAKLRKEYGLAPNEKPIKGGRIVIGVILGIIILVAIIVVVGLLRKALWGDDGDTASESVVDTVVEETAKVEETKKEEPKQETKKEEPKQETKKEEPKQETKKEESKQEESKKEESKKETNLTSENEDNNSDDYVPINKLTYGYYIGDRGSISVEACSECDHVSIYGNIAVDAGIIVYEDDIYVVYDQYNGQPIFSLLFDSNNGLYLVPIDDSYRDLECWYELIESYDYSNAG